ncbi:hypothetical protein [Gorillibacterium sp. sgz5001074]|uniref:hypothetical protein n=1 Tax=Gorillibacterium sp. sgz5001074 TaxID=3446695 RepID=UPI003F66630C
MDQLNEWLDKLSHDYLLITIAAGLFFAGKAVTGYFTYRHYNRKFDRLERLLEQERARNAPERPSDR